MPYFFSLAMLPETKIFWFLKFLALQRNALTYIQTTEKKKEVNAEMSETVKFYCGRQGSQFAIFQGGTFTPFLIF